MKILGYFDRDFEMTDKENAVVVKIEMENGDIVFAVPNDSVSKELEAESAEQPVDAQNWALEPARLGTIPKIRVSVPIERKGGKGSGNFGHSGRPGLVGGSSSGKGLADAELRASKAGIQFHTDRVKAAEMLADAYEIKYGFGYGKSKEEFVKKQLASLEGASEPTDEFKAEVLNAISEQVERGIPAPLPVIIRGERKGYNDNYTVGENREIYIEFLYHKDSKPEKAGTIGESPTNISSTYKNQLGGSYVHEVGHHIDNLAGKQLGTLADTYTETKAMRDWIKRNISYYAASRGSELVAESYALRYHPDFQSLSDNVKLFVDSVLAGKSADEYMKELKIIVKKGGKGSGNFGHAGRPGLVGGSSGKGSINLDKIESDIRDYSKVAANSKKEVGKVWDREGNILYNPEDMKGSGNTLHIPKEELLKQSGKGLVMIHSHPVDVNTYEAWSSDDIYNLGLYDIEKDYILSVRGKYSKLFTVERPEKGWPSEEERDRVWREVIKAAHGEPYDTMIAKLRKSSGSRNERIDIRNEWYYNEVITKYFDRFGIEHSVISYPLGK